MAIDDTVSLLDRFADVRKTLRKNIVIYMAVAALGGAACEPEPSECCKKLQSDRSCSWYDNYGDGLETYCNNAPQYNESMFCYTTESGTKICCACSTRGDYNDDPSNWD